MQLYPATLVRQSSQPHIHQKCFAKRSPYQQLPLPITPTKSYPVRGTIQSNLTQSTIRRPTTNYKEELPALCDII